MINRGVPKEQLPPSVNDIIGWLTEQSIDQGTIGWTTNFPEADFFAKNWDAHWTFHANTTPFHKDDIPDMLEAALRKSDAEEERSIDRTEYMKANPALLTETELEIDRQLLQAGKTQQNIDSYNLDEDTLGRKIEDLYRIQHPDPPKNYVEGYFYYGPTVARRSAPINLSINDSLGEFESGIKEYIDCLRNKWERLEAIYNEDSPWKYRWVPEDKSVKIKEVWFPLETDRDYKNLIRHAISPGKASLHLLLIQKEGPKSAQNNGTQEVTKDSEDPAAPKKWWEDDDAWDLADQGPIDGWERFDLVDDWEPGSAFDKAYLKAVEEMATDATRKTDEAREMERYRALNDQKRVESNTARQARQMSPPHTVAMPSASRPTRYERRILYAVGPLYKASHPR